jgi:hypothetical protein
VTASGEFVYTDVKQRKNFWKLQTNWLWRKTICQSKCWI